MELPSHSAWPRKLAEGDRRLPFRISFVVESDCTVVPLQQCVDCRFEAVHTVSASAWTRDPESLVRAGQFGPISSYLDGLLSRQSASSVDMTVKVEGPFLQWMSAVMQPLSGRLLTIGTSRRFDRLREVVNRSDLGEGFWPAEIVLIVGRSRSADRWLVLHSGRLPVGNVALAGVDLKARGATHVVVVWGQAATETRKVVALFHDK